MTATTTDRLDGLASSTAVKGPCKAASTTNLTLSAEQSVNSVSIVEDDRVLVTGQTDGTENGIYVASTGAWRRAKDFSSNNDVREGTQVRVSRGTNAGLWVVTNTTDIVFDTTSITIAADSSTVPTANLASTIHAATSKTTPIDADELSLWDSVALTLKKLTWANLLTTMAATAQTLTNKTLTSPVLNADVSGSAVGANSDALAGSSSSLVATPLAVRHASAAAAKNWAYNPSMQIAARMGIGTLPSIADNSYCFDRWRYIGEATGACRSIANDDFGNSSTYGQVALSTANAKGGLFQPLPARDAIALRGETVTLSASLNYSNARLGDFRMAIAEWTGTADAISADPISSWNGAGTNPTLTAGWAFLNTPANIGVGASPTKFSVSATVGASANNLALMIWVDDKSFNANDVFNISEVQLFIGSSTPRFVPNDYAVDAWACLEFCETTFLNATAPATNVGSDTGEAQWPAIIAGAAAQISPQFRFRRRKFATPTITLYNPNAGNAQVRNQTDSADHSSTSAAGITTDSFRVANTGAAGTAAGERLAIHWLAEAEL